MVLNSTDMYDHWVIENLDVFKKDTLMHDIWEQKLLRFTTDLLSTLQHFKGNHMLLLNEQYQVHTMDYCQCMLHNYTLRYYCFNLDELYSPNT
jgi:hypothetical protein